MFAPDFSLNDAYLVRIDDTVVGYLFKELSPYLLAQPRTYWDYLGLGITDREPSHLLLFMCTFVHIQRSTIRHALGELPEHLFNCDAWDNDAVPAAEKILYDTLAAENAFHPTATASVNHAHCRWLAVHRTLVRNTLAGFPEEYFAEPDSWERDSAATSESDAAASPAANEQTCME
jgi:hypothetical protein